MSLRRLWGRMGAGEQRGMGEHLETLRCLCGETVMIALLPFRLRCLSRRVSPAQRDPTPDPLRPAPQQTPPGQPKTRVESTDT